MILRFNDFIQNQITVSTIQEAILYKPGVKNWWSDKPMGKFENVFLHMEDAYRSSIKFRTQSELGTRGDYQFVFNKEQSAKPSLQSAQKTGPAIKAMPGQSVQPKPELKIVPGTEYVEGRYECYATFYLSQNGDTGKDTSTVTIFDAYGNFYQVTVGEAAQYDKSNLLKNLTVSKENILQAGRYQVLVKGETVTLDFDVNKEYTDGGGIKFNYNPKMSPGWNKPACYWNEANPFMDKNFYKTEQSRISAANKFRKFVNDNFKEIAAENDLSPSRKDSSAYCSKNIKNAWSYMLEGGYTLGQFFPYIDDAAFIAAIKQDIGAVDKYFSSLTKDDKKIDQQKNIQAKMSDTVYSLPGDSSWDYKIKDGVWFAAKKGWKSDSDWRSLAGNQAAQTKLNKQFPKASFTDLA